MDTVHDFLAAESAAFAPFEALETLSDAQLGQPVEGAHGWSGRDLAAHLAYWAEVAAGVVRDLQSADSSDMATRTDAEWERRGPAWNDELLAEWRELPVGEVRNRLRGARAEVRRLTPSIPAPRWAAHGQDWIVEETAGHYAEHVAELEAILAASR